MQNDLNERDYDLASVKEDARFLRCRKETLFALILAVLIIVIPEAITLIPNWGAVGEYRYLFGMPLWFALAYFSVIVICVICLIYSIWGIREDTLEELPGSDTDKIEEGELQ